MAKVRCLECGVILHSKYQHDFQQCNCPNQTFVDGGYEEYTRYGGMDMAKVEFVPDPKPSNSYKEILPYDETIR